MREQQRRYHSIPLRRQAPRTTEDAPTRQQSYVSHAAMPALPDEDEQYQPRRLPTSTRRYQGTEDILQQGNKRLVIRHVQAPPPRRSVHWLFPIGLTITAMLVVYSLSMWVVTTWQAHSLDSLYGMPRTYQLDAVVGHHDSAAHPSHFIFENLQGHVFILEIPGGDVTHARIYNGPVLFGPDAATVPVTGRFVDSQKLGHPDLLILIGTQTLLYQNDGTQFVAPTAS